MRANRSAGRPLPPRSLCHGRPEPSASRSQPVRDPAQRPQRNRPSPGAHRGPSQNPHRLHQPAAAAAPSAARRAIFHKPRRHRCWPSHRRRRRTERGIARSSSCPCPCPCVCPASSRSAPAPAPASASAPAPSATATAATTTTATAAATATTTTTTTTSTATNSAPSPTAAATDRYPQQHGTQ